MRRFCPAGRNSRSSSTRVARPALMMRAARAVSRSSERATSTTCVPYAAIATANASPMPDEAPSMRIVRQRSPSKGKRGA